MRNNECITSNKLFRNEKDMNHGKVPFLINDLFLAKFDATAAHDFGLNNTYTST